MSHLLKRHVSLSALLCAGLLASPAAADDAQPLCGWSPRPSMTGGGVVHTVTVGETIYALGGGTAEAPTADVLAYAPATDSWSELSPMPEPLNGFGLAELSGKLYRIGGNHSAASFTDSASAYDLANDEWAKIADLPAVLGHASAVALDGRVYAIGGATGSFASTDSVFVYDPGLDAWASVAPMLSARAAHTTVTVHGKIYAIGGIDNQLPVSSVEVYDPSVDAWSLVTPLPDGGTAAHASAAADGRLFVIGGIDSTLRLRRSAYRYDVATGSWHTLPPLPAAVNALSVAVWEDMLFTFGGLTQPLTGAALDTVNAISHRTRDGILTRSSEEAAGEHCPQGGTRVEIGRDTSCNGELDDEDDRSVVYVCRGEKADAPAEVLVESHDEPKGDNCVRGGSRVEVGTDLDGDGKLSPSEVQETTYVCHGDYGPKGANGTDGVNGRAGWSGADGSSGCSTSPGHVRGGVGFLATASALAFLGWRRRRAGLSS